MPKQSLFRVIKRWKRYEPRANRTSVPKHTRGVYVLYRDRSANNREVVYIGVAGLGRTGGGGIHRRLRSHDKKIKDWSHFSFFEVHDNVTSDEIREIEALLLGIFRDDQRIKLANKQKGSKKLRFLRRASQWTEAQPRASGRSSRYALRPPLNAGGRER